MIEQHEPSEKFGFSQYVTVRAGADLVFISGQSAYDPELNGYGDTFAAQVERCFDNLLATVRRAGASAATVAKVTTLVVDLDEERHDVLNAVMKRHFPAGYFPASALIPVARLSTPGMLIEIDAVVVLS